MVNYKIIFCQYGIIICCLNFKLEDTYLEDRILFCDKHKIGNDPGLSSVLEAKEEKKKFFI